MVRALLIAGALVATPAAAQTLDQLQNRQALQDSQRALQADSARRDTTSATVNNRIETMQLRNEIQSQRQMSLPGVGSRPLR